ncbi:MAG TPA: Asp-tRNA(Asn)/Glu-tRNA(Gln) amidotransferase subunit GatC [Steroidobacteraceae bacterium]|jgi:aspartyl-tRNA(Asn)/glutamyl-tRNA(Gln) amidotransferase subunit C|nr:Asp-tRNA(Asn)/Glu-tRNA(Gln) amidotransferase subunit GatC [Steroidobacteraceae bacterium]
MSLNRQDIDKIAQLARLALTESEVPAYVENLSRIMALVGELERADTSQVEPMAHPLPGQRQRLRADNVTATDSHELYQRNAPQVQAGLYLVPRVIE